MKSKFYLAGLALLMLFSLGSCKSKESAYKKAYDQAREREMQTTTPATQAPVIVDDNSYTTKPKVIESSFQLEKITPVDNATGLQRYNVVIGSFANKTNAVSLKERMVAKGYNVILAQNERQMYRVIVASFSNKDAAASARDSFKTQFAPEFQDAWLLEQQY